MSNLMLILEFNYFLLFGFSHRNLHSCLGRFSFTSYSYKKLNEIAISRVRKISHYFQFNVLEYFICCEIYTVSDSYSVSCCVIQCSIISKSRTIKMYAFSFPFFPAIYLQCKQTHKRAKLCELNMQHEQIYLLMHEDTCFNHFVLLAGCFLIIALFRAMTLRCLDNSCMMMLLDASAQCALMQIAIF